MLEKVPGGEALVLHPDGTLYTWWQFGIGKEKGRVLPIDSE